MSIMLRNGYYSLSKLRPVSIYEIPMSSHFKNSFINECINILKKKEVKEEIKTIMRPMVDMLLIEIYPYIFLSMIFVFISFLLILGIFILLMRYKINTTIKS